MFTVCHDRVVPTRAVATGRSSTPEVADLLSLTRGLVALATRSVEAAGQAVTLPQFRALYALRYAGPCRAGTLAQHLGTHPSTVTRLLDRLVAQGYATREVPAENRRLIELDVTPAGRDVVDAVMERRAAELARMVEALPPRARSQLRAALPHLVAVADGQHGALPEGWVH